jgi:CRISPR-associated endonuclease Csn1
MIARMKHIWSFDLGTGSIGEAVRDFEKQEFLHVASHLVPEDFASTQKAAKRRRMHRTRLAHKAREAWLDEVWKMAGQEPLKKRTVHLNPATGKWELAHPADFRLEREFPAKGDSTCYTSCLLRIKLLRGEKLETWQIYKALWSAIQRRGYDPDIPWKAKENLRKERQSSDDDERGTVDRMNKFTADLETMFPNNPDLRLPSYFDAVKMGLMNPALPENLRDRIDHTAETTRNQIVPRRLVEKEVRLLCEAASKQVPGLIGRSDFLLWGPAEKPYASSDPALRKTHGLREGGATDWQGVVGQKIPRFDNRIIEKCSLIPRLNVCKIRCEAGRPVPGSRIVFETTFLMKLRNLRVQSASGSQRALTAKEVRDIFDASEAMGYKMTTAQWKKWCSKNGVRPLPGHEEVEAPKTGGRSRFCRPALDVLKRLILSGETPQNFKKAELAKFGGNTNPLKGLVESDLAFLDRMGTTWEGIHVPDQKLDALLQASDSREQAIRCIIGSQNDPVVRHRLGLFAERIRRFHADYGEPEAIVLEFIRTDFMGKKARSEYQKFTKEREKQRIESREEAERLGVAGRGAGLRMELLRLQGGICLYTGTPLRETDLEQYQVDHIVPRERGGPDSMLNYMLTTQDANREKGARTPYEWLSSQDGWDAYVNRVQGRSTALRNKKIRLLLGEDAVELADRYTSLAETAWITKLSRAILDAFFGWRNGVDSAGKRRVVIVNGGLTARIRRKYKLNSILNPEAIDETEAEKKNRTDARHHALDAMVINFLPVWTRDAAKEGFFRFPEGVHREFFKRAIESVVPRNLCIEKPALAETIYGLRTVDGNEKIVKRSKLVDLGFRTVLGKQKYDQAYLVKQAEFILDDRIRESVRKKAREKPYEKEWLDFCNTFRLLRKDGTPGPRVLKVSVSEGTPTEFRDLSKDRSGAYRNGSRHRGQLVYQDPKGKYQVRPVYIFESLVHVRSEVIQGGGRIVDFFQSGCSVSLDSRVEHKETPLEAGIYTLSTIKKNGQTVLKTPKGNSAQIALNSFMQAGLRRL